MFLSENFYGCFVHNVLQNNERDKMESRRTAASHLFPSHIFAKSLARHLWSRHRDDREHHITADRESANVERIKVSGCSSYVLLCSALAGMQRFKTERTWKRACAAGETFSIQPASPHPPFSVSLCEQALNIHSALIWQTKWIRNSFILLPHIYLFYRLWPLPTCVLSWRAVLHGPQSL